MGEVHAVVHLAVLLVVQVAVLLTVLEHRLRHLLTLVMGGTKTIYVPCGPFYGEQVTVRTKGNNNSSKNGNNDNSSKTVPEAWSGGSGSSGGGSCSMSTSNNPNGQGRSTTSSNPDGNQHKDTKIHSGGGTCTKTGGHSPVNPNPTNLDDVTSGGGTCSSKNDTDKVSGMFGQITDGSYADTLTMQKYKNEPYKYQPNLDEKMNGDGNTFSTKGCLMTAVAINRIYKITSK